MNTALEDTGVWKYCVVCPKIDTQMLRVFGPFSISILWRNW